MEDPYLTVEVLLQQLTLIELAPEELMFGDTVPMRVQGNYFVSDNRINHDSGDEDDGEVKAARAYVTRMKEGL